MHKKVIITSFIFLVLFSFPIHAQRSTMLSKPSMAKEERIKVIETREQMKQRIDEYKSRISEIRDTRKRALIERISGKIMKANQNLIRKMTEALEKLSQRLTRLEERGAALKISGKDTTEFDQAVSLAETAIDQASAAVTEQALKEYSANITDEAGLKNYVGAMVSEFRSDISGAFKLVSAARQAVAKVISELGKIEGGNTATDSAKI